MRQAADPVTAALHAMDPAALRPNPDDPALAAWLRVLDACRALTAARSLDAPHHEQDRAWRGLVTAETAYMASVPTTRSGVALKLISVADALEGGLTEGWNAPALDQVPSLLGNMAASLWGAVTAIRRGALGPAFEGKDDCPAVIASERRDRAAEGLDFLIRRYGADAPPDRVSGQAVGEWGDAHSAFVEAVPSSAAGMSHKLDLAATMLDDMAAVDGPPLRYEVSLALSLVRSGIERLRRADVV